MTVRSESLIRGTEHVLGSTWWVLPRTPNARSFHHRRSLRVFVSTLLQGHKSIVSFCKFSSQDDFIVSGSFDGTVKVWDSQSARCMFTLTGHDDSVLNGDISRNDKLIASW